MLECLASVYEDSISIFVCFELHGSRELREPRYMQQEGASADAARQSNHVGQVRGGAGPCFSMLQRQPLNNSFRFWKFNV